MSRPSALPIWVQVALLAVLAVVMSQAVAFAVVVLAPDPRPTGFTLVAAGDALQGRPAETTDGRTLKRKVSSTEPEQASGADPIALAIRAGLAQRLGVDSDSVRVWVERRPSMPRQPQDPDFVFRARRPEPPAPTADPGPPRVEAAPPKGVAGQVRLETHVFRREIDGPMIISRGGPNTFTILADRLTFAPFSAALKLEDGRWATVTPPRGLLAPWQTRMLLALGISMLMLAPLVWWMARRLTRPIRVFADAAQRLGADPDADPLTPSGPSEVRTAIHAFNDMQGSLRDHVRKRTQTVAAIAHDLRTPLTRLRFRAEQAPEALRDRMAADIEEMDALIAQAMAYVRGDRTPDRREGFDLADLVRDCAEGFAETGAAVSFRADAALPVEADPASLRRALANLIANAVKYAGAARVRAFADDGRAVITVEDDGPGLPPEDLEAVFEPFRRAEQSRNRETGGAGLGLTVARQAARAHGGDVTLETRSPGLMARLTVPLKA